MEIKVDVTNLLSDEAGNYLTPDENENQKKLSGDEKYQSLSSAHSSVSNEEAIGPQSSSNLEKDHEDLINAANDIQNDLAAMIQEVSQIPSEEYLVNTEKKPSLEEDDDTSRQATQNYDLNDNEQEVSIDFSCHIVLFFSKKKIFIFFFGSCVNSN